MRQRRESYLARLQLRLEQWRWWYHRHRLAQVTCVGTTGSAGKTTTKDLTAAILSAFGPCSKTPGGRNQHCRLVRALRRTSRFCVAEIGAFAPASLDLLVATLQPDIAVVTMIGRDHIGSFKSREGIAVEKEKLVAAVPATDRR